MSNQQGSSAQANILALIKRIVTPIRTSYPIYFVRSIYGRVKLRRFLSTNDSAIVNLSSKVGFGAILNYYIMSKLYFHKIGKRVFFKSTNPLYSDNGEDIFASYYIVPIIPHDIKILDDIAVEFYANFIDFSEFGFSEASEALTSLKIREDVLAKQREFMGDLATFDLSIHFRGTDKVYETGKTDSNLMLEEARSVANGYDRPLNIFLATDDETFEQQFLTEFSGHRIETYKLGSVAKGQPRHFSDLTPSVKALEAMMNILLIASADHCLRTTSYLSAMSILMKPEMMWKTINRGTKKDVVFPEFQIHARERAGSEQLGQAG